MLTEPAAQTRKLTPVSATWVERHLVNRAVRLGVWLGRDIDGIQTLETAGRRTGRPRRTPVKLLELDGGRYVVSLRGESSWVRNLRQESRARILFGRSAETVHAIELPPDQRLPVIQAYLATGAREETCRALSQEVAEIPVFRLDPESRVGVRLSRHPRDLDVSELSSPRSAD